MERRGLAENYREVFNVIKVEDWKAIGNKGGYDTAEFTAVVSGMPSSCIAIQRYMNPTRGGYKSRVIGMGCSSSGHEALYEALAKLRAPGD